jgi:tRNA pseudouridine38-40 synthase
VSNHSPPERVTRTWRFVVAYRGGGFQGWQRQEGARTVQETLEHALSTIAGEPVRCRAAGRTDAGVHARGQVVSSTFTSRVPVEKILLALSSQLPADVGVRRAEVMPDGFDAKRYSVGKKYIYRIHNAPWNDPFFEATTWHVRQRLDVDAMRAAAVHYLGEKDFESFRSVNCDAAHARRYLWKAEVTVEETRIAFEVRGNAFCRHMVRCLAGTLVDVGRGRLSPDDIPRILEARDRTKAGVTGPPEGLTLEEVYYPDALGHAGIPADARFPGFPVTDEDWPPRPLPPRGAGSAEALLDALPDEGADDGG